MENKLDLQDILEECMVGFKVYDICRQQDCLVPSLGDVYPQSNKIPIKPARNGTEFTIVILSQDKTETVNIAAGEIFCLPLSVTTVNIVPDSLQTQIIVKSITKNSYLDNGYWDVVIEYKFNYAIQLLYANGEIVNATIQGTPVTSMQAYSSYEKKVTLYGAKGGKGVTYSLAGLPNVNAEKPTHYIQAKAEILEADICELPKLPECVPTGCPPKCNAVCVTIGLFTIIALIRIVKYNNISLGACNIPKCNQNMPCEVFNAIPFPFEQFSPNNQKS
ncbi:hypothetical protein IRP63_08485 [Clostridium botulinum]|uniref:Uncharacterized protein n=1 Tax=Clostridium botulinum C/D str. DC5 TaxID=1443128 RepID=A0A0A0ICI2_CLOBO|nr:hypothetical protein [Clostridium botulinum]KEI01331.1 hypothetical protein Z952_12395 [Clostridium botulinum C/D str. BKT75002]KEI12804.1 hypothetical protein Z954_04920 [Clostridium botulinum C/D str. BKT2873]KGM94278.1 hypothetical protein Z956_08160 [Clostridium botulinum D str. CCUG 7971]KGM98642.1 hypothetical protein Z955_10785 [Clostridium botulinum C/D str. DC5]KOC46263.1 hypothetical protein ADU88_12270 [Clostridium botulinum]